ncbi:NAD(P)/FAD-dependent oxidoreductase [Nitrosovibrio sp. Nv17]|uniref:NAD(P)/FAD-dependent oxidoreductase n=1 Tax=Nitrosovibrio sp. Nv17 TaxID=1855339 RepID=UPI003518A47D
MIAGGGYAGIAALTTFLRHMPEADITLVDPRPWHLKVTHLHETFRYPLDDCKVPFSELERRFGCRHLSARLPLEEEALLQWQRDKSVVVDGGTLEFDYLLIAVGAAVVRAERAENILDLNDFMDAGGAGLLRERLDMHGHNGSACISVAGGGATGIQFLFEIAHFLRRHGLDARLRLIHEGKRVLDGFTPHFSTYVQARMTELDIDFHPDTRYRGQDAKRIFLEECKTGRRFDLPSALSLLFLGIKPERLFPANAFGQIMVGDRHLPNVFTAGDCSIHRSPGSDTLTAQSAVRKGKLAARNILRHSGVLGWLEPYLHRDLGYVVSLGPTDAVGWLALKDNVVSGMPALVIKEMVEAQYDLLLTGVDTYIP